MELASYSYGFDTNAQNAGFKITYKKARIVKLLKGWTPFVCPQDSFEFKCIQITCTRVWCFGFETSRFLNFSIFWMVSDSVSKRFGIVKSIGLGFVKIWYKKKYRIRYRTNLVSEKVLDSVSFRRFGFETSRLRNFSSF